MGFCIGGIAGELTGTEDPRIEAATLVGTPSKIPEGFVSPFLLNVDLFI